MDGRSLKIHFAAQNVAQPVIIFQRKGVMQVGPAQVAIDQHNPQAALAERNPKVRGTTVVLPSATLGLEST